MKDNRGITIVALIITIIILLIILGVSLGTGNDVITKSKLENLKTNMLLIEVKAKEYIENASFDLGTNIDSESLSGEEKNDRISSAKEEFIGTEITKDDVSIFSDNLNITSAQIEEDNSQYIYYYKLTTENLEEMGLKDIKSDNSNGWYIVKYDIKDDEVEIYNTKGYKDGETALYSLNELKEIY